MKIVHYMLGIFPHRAGGLNRYATDLVREQSKKHDVIALLPGEWQPWSKTCSISKRKIIDDIICYSINNPLPLSLLFGIKKPEDFMKLSISQKSFEHFYNEFKPDVLHLHTLMGIPEEAIRFFKEKGVRIVYTSHDYFGICPKVNFINEKGTLCEGPNAVRCAKCNECSPSTFFLRIRNSETAFVIRDIIRWLRNMIHY